MCIDDVCSSCKHDITIMENSVSIYLCTNAEFADSEDGVRRKEVLKFIWNLGVLDKVGVFDTVVPVIFTTTIH